MIKHGLLICSFYLKKRYSSDDVIGLNEEYEYNGYIYKDILEIMENFFNTYSKYVDNEKHMKLFSVDKNSIKRIDEKNSSYIYGIVKSGAYGIESQITNRDSGKISYKRTKDDADIKNFCFMIYIPKDSKNVTVKKGIMLFQMIGNYGVKTITLDYLREYLSDNYSLTIGTRSISVGLFIQKLFNEGKIKKVKLLHNKISPDASDNIFSNQGRIEITHICPRFKQNFLDRLITYINGGAEDVFEIEDSVLDDIKVTIEHMGRVKTIGLRNIQNFSIVEDLPQRLYNGVDLDVEKLILYMKDTADSYVDQLIVDQI